MLFLEEKKTVSPSELKSNNFHIIFGDYKILQQGTFKTYIITYSEMLYVNLDVNIVP